MTKPRPVDAAPVTTGPKQRFNDHLSALETQLGSTATPARLALARRTVGLMLICESHEKEIMELGRTDSKEYRESMKALQTSFIALGLVLNPRTVRNEKGGTDEHAALLD